MASVPTLPSVIDMDTIVLDNEATHLDNNNTWGPPSLPSVKKDLSKFIDYNLTADSAVGSGDFSGNTFGVNRKGIDGNRRSRTPLTKFADDVVEPGPVSANIPETSDSSKAARVGATPSSTAIREDDSNKQQSAAQAAAFLSTPVGKAFGTFNIQSSALNAEIAEDYASARIFVEFLPQNHDSSFGRGNGNQSPRKRNFGQGAAPITGTAGTASLVSNAATSGYRFMHPSTDNRHFCVTPGWQLYLKNRHSRVTRPVVDLTTGAPVMQLRSCSSPAQFSRDHRVLAKMERRNPSAGRRSVPGGSATSVRSTTTVSGSSSSNGTPSRDYFLECLSKQRHREWKAASAVVMENRKKLRGDQPQRSLLSDNMDDKEDPDWQNPLPPPEEFHTVSLLLLQANGFTNEPGELLLDYIQVEAKRKHDERITLELFGPQLSVRNDEDTEDGNSRVGDSHRGSVASRRPSVSSRRGSVAGSRRGGGSDGSISRLNSELSSRGLSVHKQNNVIAQQVKNHRYLVRNNEECWISLKGVVFSMHLNKPLRTAQLLQQERYDHRVLDKTVAHEESERGETKILTHHWLGDVNFNINTNESSPAKKRRMTAIAMAGNNPSSNPGGSSPQKQLQLSVVSPSIISSGHPLSTSMGHSPTVSGGNSFITGASAAARNAKPKHPLLGDSEGRRLYYRIYLAPVYSGRDVTDLFKMFPSQYDLSGFEPTPPSAAAVAADRFATEAERAASAIRRVQEEAEAHVNAIFELFLQDFTVVGPLQNGEKYWFD